MQEDLLHFIWKYKKLQLNNLITVTEEALSILDFGMHNMHEGPDFFNAKIRIGEQLWAGNVEIHIKSSDWYAHNHEVDKKYDNVILHVVWKHDVDIFRKDNSRIPTLELQQYIPEGLLKGYENLFSKSELSFINCEKDIATVDKFNVSIWLERLYFERLERKSQEVFSMLKQTQNDWEKTLFAMLLKNFGLNNNGVSFLSIANALDFSVVRKVQGNQEQLESLLLGLAGLLEDESIPYVYYKELRKEFLFLKHKFQLNSEGITAPSFFRLRPNNFPTIRLSQLTALYVKHHNLFQKLISAKTLKEVYELCNVVASSYWDNHYVFGKKSGKREKRLSKKFIDLLIINTILPLKFCIAKHLGKDINDELIQIMTSIKNESNAIVSGYTKLGVTITNAMESQATIELYTNYCTKNKCLQCAVGSSLLNRID